MIVENPIADLVKILQWAETWFVSFNPTKTESLLISRKINRPLHPPLYMQNQQITEVESHKHLGLYFSNNLTWHNQINYIFEKAWRRINVMRKLKFRLDRKSLEVLYTSFIRPILEYGDVVWDNCSQYEKQEIEKVQVEAARIVTGTTKLISLNLLYIEAGWDSLEKGRKYHKLTLFYKMINNIFPSYLSDLVPQSVNTISHYNLRNAGDLESVASRTNQYYNSFLPSVVREWNDLSNGVRQSDSLRSFKYNINRERTIVPKHFYSGTHDFVQIVVH